MGSANLIYEVLDAFAADQDTWDRTAILLNFDENDGYFDHVSPPIPPKPQSGNGPDYYDGKPIGLGFRVPMTIVSPWTVGGFVDSEVFDHTSVLRLLERWTGVREPNISAWRRTACGDLTSAFDFTANARPRRPEQPGPVPEPIDRWTPKPPDEQAQPVQEPGKRPARPLPYQCSARAEVAEGKLRIELSNTGERTAPCLVFTYEGEARQPIPVDVLGTATVELPIPRERYRITVLGPNRFRFDARGGSENAALAAGLRIENAAPFAELRASEARTVRLESTHYAADSRTARIPAGSSRRIPVPVQDGWYEVRLSCPEDPELGVWMTGHVENGRPSISG
ncbi:alkaline phosphatase family protein [Sciscionella marina]|uniref:alkaline phosphatase family protein n=1 Tax=Sciscionella marina TaxID=508770 RepID=UPI00039EE51A|nr:alkaline phosphatase family protein [Sciscionella marina]